MKILILSKRQYTNKDLLDDQYGRLWEIPLQLAHNGLHIKGLCLSYRHRQQGQYALPSASGSGCEWLSYNVWPGLLHYLYTLQSLLRNFKPDVLWVSSDCPHVLFGVVVGKLFSIPCVVDLYDNYEYFRLSSIPGLVSMYRKALTHAEAITCVSKPLRSRLQKINPMGTITVIENAVDRRLFYPRDKIKCRKILKLPDQAKIIGTAGALQANRNIVKLYDAFALLADENPLLHLALAGVGPRNHSIFQHPRVQDLGVLNSELIPLLFNALDVAIVCNQDNEFSKYCYPQKGCEILACQIPLVAARIGVMEDLLAAYPQCLFDAGQTDDLAEKIKRQLVNPDKLSIPINTWSNLASKLQELFATLSR